MSWYQMFAKWLEQQPADVRPIIGTVVGAVFLAFLGALATGSWKGAQAVLRRMRDKRSRKLTDLMTTIAGVQPPRLGLAEALVEEERAIATLMSASQAITEVMGRVNSHGHTVDQRVKQLSKALRGGDPNTRAKFNFAVESFAAEVNHAMAKAEPQVEAMAAAVDSLRSCHAILYKPANPPQAWVDQHDYYVGLRSSIRQLVAVYRTTDATHLRGLRNDLDAALDRRQRFKTAIAGAMADFESLLTRMIEAVDRLRR